MTQEKHFRRLENMYQAAPINKFYLPQMKVSQAQAEISIEVDEKHHHSGGGVHGSVYFKMLDDAAFFAANSLEPEVFVLTTSFTTYLTRPVAFGKLTARGKVVNSNKSQFIAEAVLYDQQDNEIGRGNGIFVRGKLPLTDAKGYLSDDSRPGDS